MRFLFRCLLPSLIIAGLSLPAAAAPEKKPDASIKTRAIEANITIDPALHAYPGLYPRLLASGKRAMAKWQGYADKDYRENRKFFSDGRSYEFERGYDQRSVIQGYVSIVFTDYSYSAGAAHPNHAIDTLLWDTKAAKFINIRPFFTETAGNGPTLRALAAALRAAVKEAKKARGVPVEAIDDPMWLGNIKPDLTKIGGIALAPSTERDKSAGLIAYFAPYAVGPYAEGSYTVFVPWTTFKAHLSATGAALFGGTRPPDDAKRDEQ